MFFAVIKHRDPRFNTVNDMLVKRLEKDYRIAEYQSISEIDDLPDVYLSRFSSGLKASEFWPIVAYLEEQGVKAVNRLNLF